MTGSTGRYPVDCIYIAASSRDARFTRICAASIRYFYPGVPVRLLVGGPLERGLAEELAFYWDVGLADHPRCDYGWGFVKLEPLFGRSGERFLVLDSDTVFVGPALDAWQNVLADFVVDDEQLPEADTHRLYYNWRNFSDIDPLATPPRFVFNSGQWFGTAGLVMRTDFDEFVDWGRMPPVLRHPGLFMPGDQGVLNYVLNRKAARDGLSVARCKIMHWPGHGMGSLTAACVSKRTARPLIVHWAGIRRARHSSAPGGDILIYFEKEYYRRLPGGEALRLRRAVNYAARQAWRGSRLGHRLSHLTGARR